MIRIASLRALCALLLLGIPHDSARRAEPAPLPDAKVAAALAVRECKPLRPEAMKAACYEQAFGHRLAAIGVRDALATLAGAAAADSEVARDSHVYAHGIGIEAYRLVPSVAETFPRCSAAFASGCYHGVIQAHLDGLPAIGRREIDALCALYRGEGGNRWLLFQCLHGAGHGLTMHYGHELPRALSECGMLTDAWERESCYGGAFMENIMQATELRHPATRLAAHHHPEGSTAPAGFQALDPGDPLYPCSAVAPPYRKSCYLLQTSAMLHFNGGSIAAAAKSCDLAPAEMRPFCYQSLGRDVSAYAGQDPGRSVQLCELGTPAYRPSCYFGAAKSLIDWAARTEPGLRMCQMVVSREGGRACYEAVGEQVAALYADTARRAAECEAVESGRSRRACRYGARLNSLTGDR